MFNRDHLTALHASMNRIFVLLAGAIVGFRPRINFIEGAGIDLTIVDNAATNSVDLTIAATGGGGAVDIKAIIVNVPSPIKNFETVILDAAVTALSQIMIDWGNCLQSDANHPGMGEVAFNAKDAAAGQFTLEIFSMDAGNLFGDFKVGYVIG